MKTRLSALVVAAGLLLSGCMSSKSAEPAPTTVTATATTTVTSTPKASPGVTSDGTITTTTVADLADLKALAVKIGLKCDSWRVAVENMAGECDGGVLLSAFPTTDAGRDACRAAVARSYRAIIDQNRSDIALLVGPNWFIRADTQGAYLLQDRMGGIVIGL